MNKDLEKRAEELAREYFAAHEDHINYAEPAYIAGFRAAAELLQGSGGSEDNEYHPWIDLGVTETEYWRRKYIEARASGYEEALEEARTQADSPPAKESGCKECGRNRFHRPGCSKQAPETKEDE